MINIGSYIFHKVHLSIGGIIPVEIRKYSWLVQTSLIYRKSVLNFWKFPACSDKYFQDSNRAYFNIFRQNKICPHRSGKDSFFVHSFPGDLL